MDRRLMRCRDFLKSEKTYNDVKEWVYMILVSEETYLLHKQRCGERCIHVPMPGSMKAMMALLIVNDDGEYSYMPITESMIAKCGVSEEEAVENAYRNTNEKFSYTMYECSNEHGRFVMSSNRDREFHNVIVDRGVFRGSAILNKNILKEVSEKLGGNLYILQISKDSSIVTIDDGTVDTEELFEILITDDNIKNAIARRVLYFDAETLDITEVPHDTSGDIEDDMTFCVDATILSKIN